MSSADTRDPAEGNTGQRTPHGGPRTPQGRERSSRNATTHGARSKKHAILPGESEAEYEAIRDGWLAEFKPQSPLEIEMVTLLVQRHWSMKRCDRLCAEAEEKLFFNNPDLTAWSEEDHRNLQRFQRYRTSSSRAYKAALSDVENLRANRIKEPLLEQRLRREVHHNAVTGALTKQDLADQTAPAPATSPDHHEKTPKWPPKTS